MFNSELKIPLLLKTSLKLQKLIKTDDLHLFRLRTVLAGMKQLQLISFKQNYKICNIVKQIELVY